MDMVSGEVEDLCLASVPKLVAKNGRPTSMVLKKRLAVIPAHLVAEAISTLHGRDLRWSGPITPSEIQYVQQYILTKYPQYSNGLIHQEFKSQPEMTKIPLQPSLPCATSNPSDLDKTQLEPSRLLHALAKKSSFLGDFTSIPEIQARNRALSLCGLPENDYSIVFAPNYGESMAMIGESYPFFKGNYYLTIIDDRIDCLRDNVVAKEGRVVAAPEVWLDLRIKGSKLSQHFRRKSKNVPKGLFSYPAVVEGTRYSMHWISEARRSSWHVLLDATGAVAGEERLNLALHQPDFVVCTVDDGRGRKNKVTCVLVRRNSFPDIL